MLVNIIEMLNKAKNGKYAVGQYNINNLEWTKYILEVAEELKTPVILGVSEGAIKYMGGYNTVYGIVSNLIMDLGITVDVCLHLDHGSSVSSCIKAVDAGFTSVMIDASQYSLDENINMTNEVLKYARERNVSVEAEIGHIGGVEDNIKSSVAYAKLEDAIRFVNETSVDILAPALGSSHGIYTEKPVINFELMESMRDTLNIPLVMHGGTGLDDETITRCIENGICKININTELQLAWSKSVREFVSTNTSAYDPRKFISSGEKSLKETLKDKIKLFKTK